MDIQAILVILYCFACKIQLVELSILRCPSNQYKHYGYCCNKCGPGTFVLTHCTNTTQTICETCNDGTFSSDWTSKEECTKCSNYHCRPSVPIIQTCNSTVDNKCGCVKPDQFHHIASDSCRNCPLCKAGEYPVKPCSEETHCTPCPKDHFSNKSSNYKDECVKCTECEHYESMCTSTKDAVCRRKLTTTPKVQTTFFTKIPTRTTVKWKPTGPNSRNPSGSNSQKQIVVSTKIIIVMIVAVFIVALAMCAMVYWRRKKVTDRNRCAGFNIIEEPIERCQTTISFGSLLLRDQPAKVILGLHYRLNPESPNNWRTLAAELEVPYLQILHYENNLETAAKEMLHSWGTSDSATVNRLYQALRKIGRDDACEFLEENVEIPESEETLV